MERFVNVFDAAGLGLFCVTGALKALEYGLGPVPAALMGMVTGIGGGMARDLLAGRVPVVFSSELYATPALLGATWAVLADGVGTARGAGRHPGRGDLLRPAGRGPAAQLARPAAARVGQRLTFCASRGRRRQPSAAEHAVEVGVGEDPVGVEPVAHRQERPAQRG